jgi:hypothetical protein
LVIIIFFFFLILFLLELSEHWSGCRKEKKEDEDRKCSGKEVKRVTKEAGNWQIWQRGTEN